MRGGYENKRQLPEIKNAKMALEYIHSLHLGNDGLFLNSKAQDMLRREDERIVQEFEGTGFPFINFRDYLYTVYRQGRHISTARQGSAYGSFAFTPFLDDTALLLAWKIPLALRKDETLYYNILNRLHPELSVHRFADSRWVFERKGPVIDDSKSAWLERAPLPPSPAISGAHNWRMGYDDYLRPIVRDFLLDNKNSVFYQMIKFNKLRRELYGSHWSTLFKKGKATPYNVLSSIFGILNVVYCDSNLWQG